MIDQNHPRGAAVAHPSGDGGSAGMAYPRGEPEQGFRIQLPDRRATGATSGKQMEEIAFISLLFPGRANARAGTASVDARAQASANPTHPET